MKKVCILVVIILILFLTSCDPGQKIQLTSVENFEDKIKRNYSDFILLDIKSYKPDIIRLRIRVRGDKEWAELKELFEENIAPFVYSDEFIFDIVDWLGDDYEVDTKINMQVQIDEYYDNDVQYWTTFSSSYILKDNGTSKIFIPDNEQAIPIWINTENDYNFSFNED